MRNRSDAQAYLERWLYKYPAYQEFTEFATWWAKVTNCTHVQALDHVQATYFSITRVS